MLIVPIDNVTEGMVLAKDVASTSARDYKALLMKGTLITADMINLLKSKGIKNVTIKGERTLDQEIDKPPEEESLEEATDVIKNQHIGKALDELSTIFEHNGEIQQLSQKAIEQVDDIADDILVDIGNDSTYLGNQMIALQNYDDYTYKHCLLVSMLSTGIANELHLSQGDTKEVILAALLHDIGKALDHEIEGSHVQIGVDICRKYKENTQIIHAIEAHHGDVEPKTPLAFIIQACDAISAARPGARRENVESYVKRLENLEEISSSFEGVEQAFAVQAGREVRIMVKPDGISDDQVILLARQIAKKIEDTLDYPGQFKVIVIRESRAIEYAK